MVAVCAATQQKSSHQFDHDYGSCVFAVFCLLFERGLCKHLQGDVDHYFDSVCWNGLLVHSKQPEKPKENCGPHADVRQQPRECDETILPDEVSNDQVSLSQSILNLLTFIVLDGLQ